MWNGEGITGINGYLFDSQKIVCARRASPRASKRMCCFDFAATVLFLHSDFHLLLTFIWAENLLLTALIPLCPWLSQIQDNPGTTLPYMFPSALPLDRPQIRADKKVQEEVKVNMLLLHNYISFIWENLQTVATKGWKQSCHTYSG